MSFPFFSQNQIINKKHIHSFITHFAKDDNWHEMDITSGNLGYAWTHYTYIRLLKPKNVLCIGSRYGFIPAICALACRDNNYGKVDFVDASYDQDNQDHKGIHWGGVGFWKTKEGKKQFRKFGLNKFIKLHVMKSSEFFKKTKKTTKYSFGKKWGYAHLDGDHSYDGVKYDFKETWPNLIRGGMVAFHDINTPDNMGDIEYGTQKFWQEIKKDNSGCIEIPGTCGLGLLQKT